MGAFRTDLLTEGSGPAGGAVAGPRYVVARATVLTPTLVFAVLVKKVT